MKELLDKISSYKIFNYLFPGAVFAIVADYVASTSLVQESIIEGLFLYYFLGLVLSRVGSLVIEPILKKRKFIVFADYDSFDKASKKEKKIEVLSEVNNMYRTLISTFLLLLLLMLYEALRAWVGPWIANYVSLPASLTNYVLIILLIALFLASYRKQTKYVVKRIKTNL